MKSTAELSHAFLVAAQALADRMLAELGGRDPALGQQVADALEAGESLSLAFVYGQEPRIELSSISDYGTKRTAATIPLRLAQGLKN